MSSKFKINKEDRNPIEILADISADSKMNSIEWHLAEKIFNNLSLNHLLASDFWYREFKILNKFDKQKFLALAKEILGEELNDNSTEN